MSIRVDAWFCRKCHGYNPCITMCIAVIGDKLPKKIPSNCKDCGAIQKVGLTGKELV